MYIRSIARLSFLNLNHIEVFLYKHVNALPNAVLNNSYECTEKFEFMSATTTSPVTKELIFDDVPAEL